MSLGLKLWKGGGGGPGHYGLGSAPVHTANWRAPGRAGRCSLCSWIAVCPER